MRAAVSTIALLVAALAQLGLMQAEGGLFDSCRGFTSVGVDLELCRAITAGISHKGWLALAVAKARAENAFAIGHGVGAVFGLLFLRKGTREVAVVHLMHATWAAVVCLANAQVAGLLERYFGIPTEPGIRQMAHIITPFVFITGAQAVLYLVAFLLSVTKRPPQKAKTK